jgi:ankyrin repeat protein
MNISISLIEAACIGRNDIIGTLLERGDDINEKNQDGYSAIHYAIHNG